MSDTQQPMKKHKLKKPTKAQLNKIKALIVAARLKDKDTDFLVKLCSLYEHGVSRLVAVFYGSGDSGDLYDIQYFAVNGENICGLNGYPDIVEPDGLRDELYELFSENVTVDWVNNEGGGGELTIELPSFKINVNSYYNEINKVPEDDVDITLSVLEGLEVSE